MRVTNACLGSKINGQTSMKFGWTSMNFQSENLGTTFLIKNLALKCTETRSVAVACSSIQLYVPLIPLVGNVDESSNWIGVWHVGPLPQKRVDDMMMIALTDWPQTVGCVLVPTQTGPLDTHIAYLQRSDCIARALLCFQTAFMHQIPSEGLNHITQILANKLIWSWMVMEYMPLRKPSTMIGLLLKWQNAKLPIKW